MSIYLTQNDVVSRFTYKDGQLFKHNGKRAGSLYPSGYRCIAINKIRYYEHKIIWLYHYGVLPACQIDHINQIKDDNRIENLRLCLRNDLDNSQNQSIQKNNTSGHIGVYKSPTKGKWCAEIKSNKRRIHLGTFNTYEDAVSARKESELKHFKFIN